MVAADMIAIAFRRSSGANIVGSTDSDIGKIADAPTPSSARAPISSPVEVATAHNAEAAPNSTSATSSTRLRP